MMSKAYNLKDFMKAASDYRYNVLGPRVTKEEKEAAEMAFKPERDKLQAVLDSGQKRAKTRVIISIMVYDALTEIENKLGISKKALDGVKVYVDVNDQNFPKAYKYKPESTWFNAEFKRGTWYLTDVYRDETARLNRGKIVELTEAAKTAVLENMACF